LRIRSGPGTSHSVITYLSEGDIIVILERTNSEWYKVNFHGSIGYVSAPLLRDVLTAENFNAQGRIVGDRVNIRTKPNVSSDVLGTYKEKTEMTVIGINNGWYKVKHEGLTGYVRSDFMDIISGYKAAAASSSASSSSSSTKRTKSAVPVPDPNLPEGQKIVDFALAFLGYNYVYGAESPSQGFDCSGLTYYVYKECGYSIRRTASTQFKNDGVLIENQSDLALGDLVFFSSNGGKGVTHVGIYIGDEEFVHASRPGIGVVISRLDSSYYTKGWCGGKRVFS
jgi:cell wall-associated NlpC family hydrolase